MIPSELLAKNSPGDQKTERGHSNVELTGFSDEEHRQVRLEKFAWGPSTHCNKCISVRLVDGLLKVQCLGGSKVRSEKCHPQVNSQLS